MTAPRPVVDFCRWCAAPRAKASGCFVCVTCDGIALWPERKREKR
jgi:hypothetical protein